MEIKKDYLYPFIISFLFFCLYLYLSPPGIIFGDSPELILASYTLGIAHPPGYPLYSILTRAFHYLIPFISYDRACNIFSIFVSSVSLFIFFTTLRKINISLLISILVTITLGFSEVYIKQSLISEVYSLNNFFFTLSFYIIVSYYFNNDKRKIFLAFFITGVGLANHHTLLSVFIIEILFFIILYGRDLKTVLISLLFFLLGLTVYLYLPFRSKANPALDWGDPESLDSFLDVILRKQFGFGGGDRSFDKFVNQIVSFGNFLNDQIFIFLILIMLFGVFLLIKKEKKLFVLFLIFLINGVLTPIALNSSDEDFFLVKEFLTPSIISALIFVAYGINKFSNKKWFTCVYLTIFVFTVSYKFYYDIETLNRRNDVYAYKLAEDSLKNLPTGSFLIGESDYTLFPLWYVQYVDGLRRDVTVLDADFLMLPWYQKQNINKLPILKGLIPDISSHSSSRKGSVLDEAVLEGFKLDQSELLAKNIKDKLGKEVFFTYDFFEMAKFYKPQLLKILNQYGLVYHLTFDNRLSSSNLSIDLNHLSKKINLSKEELIFLTPYVPYLIEKADDLYRKFDIVGAINYLNNAFYISPSPEKAIYLAYALADEGKNLEKAERLLHYAEKNSMVSLPKQNLVKGLISLRKNRFDDAYVFLSQEEKNNPMECDAKIFLIELLLKKSEKDMANRYFAEIQSICGDYYIQRAKKTIITSGGQRINHQE